MFHISDVFKNLGSISSVALRPMVIKNPEHADNQYENLKITISNFQDSLSDDEEVAVLLSSFGQSILVNVTNIGYSNPSLLHFYGFLESGARVELVQHVSQLNFLLLANKKLDPCQPARRIGFSAEL